MCEEKKFKDVLETLKLGKTTFVALKENDK